MALKLSENKAIFGRTFVSISTKRFAMPIIAPPKKSTAPFITVGRYSVNTGIKLLAMLFASGISPSSSKKLIEELIDSEMASKNAGSC